MKLLSTYDIAQLTGISYGKALKLIKGMNHIQLDNRYYVSEANFQKFMTQDYAVHIKTNEEGGY